HPEDRPLVYREMQRAGADRSHNYQVEHRVLQPDGSVRWIIARGRVERDGQDQPLRMRGVALDVTERKQAEAERESLMKQLEQERAGLAKAFEQSPAFIAVLRGPDHVFEFVNDRYYLLIGRRDLIGKPVRQAL